MKQRLLIVEDDVFVLELLGSCLRQHGYDISLAKSGAEMFQILEKFNVDLILLDLTLPDEDGIVLTRQIRTRSNIPIIILTSRDCREDRLSTLELGADDYLTKPCDTDELLLRIRNLIARSATTATTGVINGQDETQEFAGFILNIAGETLIGPDQSSIPLTRSEFTLLHSLTRARNRVLTRDFLLDAVSPGDDGASGRLIDVLVSRLRKKLGDDPRSPELIQTVPGRGYRFVGK